MQNGDVSTKKSLIRYDWGFHQSLILACKSANLISLHSLLYYKFLRYQMLLTSSRGSEAVNEHKKIFDSALERDFPRAEKELKNHFKRIGRKERLQYGLQELGFLLAAR